MASKKPSQPTSRLKNLDALYELNNGINPLDEQTQPISERQDYQHAQFTVEIEKLKPFKRHGDFAFTPAVTLSFLRKEEQARLNKCLEANNFSVDMKRADILRKYSEKEKLDDNMICRILGGEVGQKPKPNRTPVVKVQKDVYAKFFKLDQSQREVQEIVEKALELYFAQNGD